MEMRKKMDEKKRKNTQNYMHIILITKTME